MFCGGKIIKFIIWAHFFCIDKSSAVRYNILTEANIQ